VAVAPTTHVRVRIYSTGNCIELSVSAACRTHQSQRTTMKQLIAKNGIVHQVRNTHGVDQPGHALGGLSSSNIAIVEADRSSAIKVTTRAEFIAKPVSVRANVRNGSKHDSAKPRSPSPLRPATGPLCLRKACPQRADTVAKVESCVSRHRSRFLSRQLRARSGPR
jgi:hypothetical protein